MLNPLSLTGIRSPLRRGSIVASIVISVCILLPTVVFVGGSRTPTVIGQDIAERPHARTPAPPTPSGVRLESESLGEVSPAAFAAEAPSTFTKSTPTNSATDTPPGTDLHAAQRAAIEADMALATAVRSRVVHEAGQPRKLATAKIKLELAQLDHERYSGGLADNKQSAMRDQIRLAKERCTQISDRLQWSEKLANQGLISVASLESDQVSVDNAQSDMRAAQNRLHVFEVSTRKRTTIELSAAVDAARAEMAHLREMGAATSAELATHQRLAQETVDEARRRVDVLLSQSVELPSVPPVKDELLINGQRRTVTAARATLRRAEVTLSAQQNRNQDFLAQAQQRLAAAELKLSEFLRGKSIDRRHEKQTEIRSISEALNSTRQQLDWSKRVYRKSYITRAQLESDRLAVEEQLIALKQAESELKTLEEHELRRRETELEAAVAEAREELRRQQQINNALLEEARVVAAARKEALQLESERLDQLGGLARHAREDDVAG